MLLLGGIEVMSMSALGFSFGPEEAATETPPYPCKLLYCNGRDCVGASPALSLLCCVQVVANETPLYENIWHVENRGARSVCRPENQSVKKRETLTRLF